MNKFVHNIATMNDILDYASAAQLRAADPSRSVWVNASAGTGKTKVLIERVIRLLLPHSDGTPGTFPDRILCLTYTRAAASEMTERLLKRLSVWAVCDEEKLYIEMEKMLGAVPTPKQITAARGLFTQLVDGPRHIRIMTIHAFCQSVLSRFPIEAGVAPGFTLIEEIAAKEMINQARENVIIRAVRDENLREKIDYISANLSDDSFSKLLEDLFFESRQLRSSFDNVPVQSWGHQLRIQLELSPDDNIKIVEGDISSPPEHLIADLINLAQSLGNGTKTDQGHAQAISKWITYSPQVRIEKFDELIDVYFTSEGDRRSASNQGVRKKDPHIANLYASCGDQIGEIVRRRDGLELVQANESLLFATREILNEYERLKRAKGVLDFDDLIEYTAQLLNANEDPSISRSSLPTWVMYKLDGGIDHILLDEAQDTNPQQWAIIRALAREFYTRDHESRTLFVVGDQKQSIYRFQGADPDSFEQSLHHLSMPISSGRSVFDRVLMNTSFRSAAPILTAVDQIFDTPELRKNLRENQNMIHVPSRLGQASRVELWPLISINGDDKGVEIATWEPPITIREIDNAHARMADKIARQIKLWLDQGEMLPSRGRPIMPGDILILVRKRAPLLPMLIASLRAHNIPVSGMDRMQLSSALVVQDLLAIMRFVVTPDDDLNLACFLKSPIINMNDDDLIALAPGRPGRLYDSLKNYKGGNVYQYITQLMNCEKTQNPYTFLSYILQSPCPGDENGSGMRALSSRLGSDAKDPVDELLTLALDSGSQPFAKFLRMLDETNPTIKRDQGQSGNVVRLMTVHGSKGLEAPVVILPDTVLSRDARAQSIFWPDETGMKLPIWSPKKSERPKVLQHVIAQSDIAEHAEYNRLLYVALTRAQDVLIIAGAQTGKTVSDKSWYETVRKGMLACENLPGFEVKKGDDGDTYVLGSRQTAAPDRVREAESDAEDNDVATPAFLTTSLKSEAAPARPYRPDRPSGASVPQSPFAVRDDATRFLRGVLTHKLLQVLPEIAPGNRDHAGGAYLDIHGAMLDVDVRLAVLSDVLNVMADPALHGVFGPGSRAEVAVTGMVNGRLVAGRMDRVLITPERIVVVDFKTGGTVPGSAAAVPAIYQTQMQTYRDLLCAIYPGRPVECALIYTNGAAVIRV